MNISLKNFPKYATRDAIRLGLQCAIAGATTYILMRTFSMQEVFVGVLSAALVIEVSIGASLGNSIQRLLATLVGCAIGITSLFLLPDSLDTPSALFVSLFLLNGLAVFRPAWRYGVVAAVALSLGSENDMVQASIDRSLAILLGVTIGSLTAAAVWPEKAVDRGWRQVRAALSILAEYMKLAIELSLSEEKDNSFDDMANRFSTELSNARSNAAETRISDDDKLLTAIDSVERLYHSIVISKRVSDSRDIVQEDGEGTADSIRGFQNLVCEIAVSLSDGETVADEKLDSLKDKLQELKGNFSESNSVDWDDIEENAFVFGISEVCENLRSLNEVIPENE